MAIKLGTRVRDTFTGFEGIAVSRTEWLYGCARIGIQPTVLKDGKPIDTEHFDEQRVVEVTPPVEAPAVSPQSSARSGGPQRDPGRAADPRR